MCYWHSSGTPWGWASFGKAHPILTPIVQQGQHVLAAEWVLRSASATTAVLSCILLGG
jgi:hypothetical protein